MNIKIKMTGNEINNEEVNSPKKIVFKVKKKPPEKLGVNSKILFPLLLVFIKKEYRRGDIDIIEEKENIDSQTKKLFVCSLL